MIRFDIRVFPLAVALTALPVMAQVTPETSAPNAAQAAPAQKTRVPDYPEPRTFTIGLFYWLSAGTQPSLYSGHKATDDETLQNLGKSKKTPGIELSIPITRTGEIKFEYSRTQGDGNQTAPAALNIVDTSIARGDYLATQYKMQRAKVSFEDLLFPHKFPVAKFRLKSLWGAQLVHIRNTVDAPLVDATGVKETASGSKEVMLPTLGMAAEYALTPHILLRADGSGFGLYHKADIWDANAIISFRKGPVEVLGGARALHFKTSPNTVEFETATFTGAFAGLRWHWGI